MRLLRLKIKNIASLQGDHLIDFEKIESQSNLFAITGETGSGKSTILNAISLSLFGEVYKKNVHQADVITLGEKDGEIQLIFQVKGKYYLAEWRARIRKQSGEFLKQPQIQRTLYQVDQNNFEANKLDVIPFVETLLNLNFDQFCKCIVLNQGEFARFLTSSFTERKEILEKLYPGELLDNVSKVLKTELDDLNHQKNDLEIKLVEINETEINEEELQRIISEATEGIRYHDHWAKSLEEIEFHFSSFMTYHKKYNEGEQKINILHQEIESITSTLNFKRIGQAEIEEKVNHLRLKQEKELPKLQKYLQSEEALKIKKQQVTLIESKIETRALNSEKIKKEKDLLRQDLDKWDSIYHSFQLEFKHELTALKAHYPILQHFFSLLPDYISEKKELEQKKEKLSELEQHGQELSTKVKNLEIEISQNPIIDANEKLKILGERKNHIHQQNEQIKIAQIQSKENLKILEILKLENELDEKKSALLQDEIRKLTKDQFLTSSTLKLLEIQEALGLCLNHSIQNNLDSCPLCHQVAVEINWNELLSANNQSNFLEIKEKHYRTGQTLTEKTEENKYLQERIKKNTLTQEEKTLYQEELHKKSSQEIITTQEVEEQITVLQKIIWNHDHFQKELTKYSEEIKEARTAYSKCRFDIEDINKKIIHFKNSFTQLSQNTQGLIPSSIEEANLEELKNDFHRMIDLKNHEFSGSKLKSEFDIKVNLLNSLLNEIKELNTEQEKTKEAISLLVEELVAGLGSTSASEAINKLNEEYKIANETLVQKEKELKKDELVLKDLQGRYQSLKDQLKEYESLFLGERHFLNHLSINLDGSLNDELVQLIQKLIQLRLTLNDSENLFTPLFDLINQTRVRVKEASNKLRMVLATTLEKLSDWQKRKAKALVLLSLKEEIKRKAERLQKLFEVLGRDELRSFVLSLVEKNLIIQTNNELKHLCQGRYEITHQNKGMKLAPDFFIFDKYREGGKRKISTLSGGETFMVSLAMAMALAELTRGHAEIDSLFIDEGFGTLDQDSLEDVLAVLNQIQTRGLLVGIISHVKVLTDSLAVNLHLTKKQNGNSSLNLIFN